MTTATRLGAIASATCLAACGAAATAPDSGPDAAPAADASPSIGGGGVLFASQHGAVTADDVSASFLEGVRMRHHVTANCFTLGAGGGQMLLPAGTIALSFNGVAAGSMDFQPSIGGYELAVPGGFPAGAHARAAASGDVVPPFSGEVVLPSPIVSTYVPDIAMGFSKSAGLHATWTPADPGTTVSFVIQKGGGGVACEVPDDLGAADIPAALLVDLPTGLVDVSTIRERLTQVATSPYDVTVTAIQQYRRQVDMSP